MIFAHSEYRFPALCRKPARGVWIVGVYSASALGTEKELDRRRRQRKIRNEVTCQVRQHNVITRGLSLTGVHQPELPLQLLTVLMMMS